MFDFLKNRNNQKKKMNEKDNCHQVNIIILSIKRIKNKMKTQYYA